MHGILRRLIRENIILSIHVPEDLWDVSADPGNCEQLVLNMAVNARDAMPEGGRLSIELANVCLTVEEAARLRMGREGEFVAVRIIDTGTGMSLEVVNRIFEPFFTTKGRDRGTGLGLSTCEGIVTQAGGFIDVTSTPGAGTTFSIYFPRTTMPGVHAEAVEQGPTQVTGGVETILLVEDEEAVRMLATRVLRGLGYTVVETSNGIEALAALEKYQSGIDLVISDLVMHQTCTSSAPRLPSGSRMFRAKWLAFVPEYGSGAWSITAKVFMEASHKAVSYTGILSGAGAAR
jgi:CheY-like chemotaxis protein